MFEPKACLTHAVVVFDPQHVLVPEISVRHGALIRVTSATCREAFPSLSVTQPTVRWITYLANFMGTRFSGRVCWPRRAARAAMGAAKCRCNSVSVAPAAGSRLAASLAEGPAGHPSRAQSPRRGAEGDRATGRHWLRGRNDLSYSFGDAVEIGARRYRRSEALGDFFRCQLVKCGKRSGDGERLAGGIIL